VTEYDQRNRAPKPPSEAGALIIEGRIEALEREQQEDKKRDNEYKQRQLRFNKLLVIFTGGLLLAAVIANSISIYQSVQSKKSADAAKQSADAAKKAADTADATLKSSRESFQTEQRPYLVAEVPQFIVTPIVPGVIRANVTFRDIGRTPATRIRRQIALLRYRPIRVRAKAIEKLVAFVQVNFEILGHKLDEAATEEYSALVREDLAPNGSNFSTAEIKEPLLATELPELQEGSLTLFYIGVLRYTDAYKGSYETQFCYFYFGTDPKVWHICDSHNTIK
jgi:hypothetical protein